MTTTSALIVGAGPTGLTLACELARRGVACRVIDRAPRGFPGSRAKGLQPRTLEVFEDLGVLPDILAGGAPFPPFRLYVEHTLKWQRTLEEMLGVPATPATAAIPHPRAWLIAQWRTDEILHDRLVALGGAVDRGVELTDFTQDADGVHATLRRDGRIEHQHARFLVGADGGHSVVRRTLGLDFAGETDTSERTLIGDVQVDGLEGEACHIFTRAGDMTRRFSLWNLPGSDHYQMVAALDPEAAPDLSLAGVQRLLDERSGRSDLRLHDLRWISVYRINVRMAERFRVGRVFLAGDAAHVHSSAGGQGLNTSVQDAYNLGWKLAAVLAGAPADLLDSYEAERLPVAARVLASTTALHRQDFRTSGEPPPALHQLDITYRDGPLALDDRRCPGALRAGDRAPDARLPDGTRLFDHLRGPHFTLLAFARPAPALGVPTLELAELAGYDVADGSLVLIRPDGHIAAITDSAQRVRDHLRRMTPVDTASDP